MPVDKRALALLAVLVPISSHVAQAQMFRGDAAHHGAFNGLAADHFGGLQWRVQTGGPVRSSPVIAGRTVYVGSSDGLLYAIDVVTGAVRWRTSAGGGISSSPAISDGRAFVLGNDRALYAIDVSTGRVTWKYQTGPAMPLAWGFESGLVYESSPTVADSNVLVGALDGNLYALDARTGRVRWRASTGSRIYASPAVANDAVFVGGQDGSVHAFSLATGTRLWRFATTGAALHSGDFGFDRTTVQSSPAVDHGAVFVGARDGFLYSIDAVTGRERWRMDHRVSWVNSSPAVDDGVVYAGSSDAHFIQAVDATTGTELWRAKTTLIVWASPSVDRQLVYVGEGDGTLYALDKHTGAERWRWRAGGRIVSSAALGDGRVIVGTDDGGVYAIDGKGAPLHRAVFWDSASVDAPMAVSRPALRNYLSGRGFEVLNAAALSAFMTDRVNDREPSSIVFAVDHVPPQVAPVAADTVLFRRYLNAGGTVVWCGAPPLIAPSGFKGLKDLDRRMTAELIGVHFEHGNFDPIGVARLSDRARQMGLPAWWLDSWGADTAGLTRVLAYDEFEQAAAWIKGYGGPPGTGFVRMPCPDGAPTRAFTHLAVQTAAEWRGR